METNKAYPPKTTNKLIGIWKLSRFANIQEDGIPLYWAGDLNGYLIYTPDGYVTAAINRSRSVNGDTEFKNSFYVATVKQIDDTTIEHLIVASSDPARIGGRHIRKFRLEGEQLILSGIGLTGHVELTWVKEAAKANKHA